MDFSSALIKLEALIASGKRVAARELHKQLLSSLGPPFARPEDHLVLKYYEARILFWEGGYVKAVDLAREIFDQFKHLDKREWLARCHLLLSSLMLRTGDYLGARAHAEAAVYFYTWEIDDRTLKADAYNKLGVIDKNLGSWDEAERNLKRALRDYGPLHDPISNLKTSLNLAILLRKMGRFVEAESICREGVHLAGELGIPIGICRYALEWANIDVVRRDVEAGEEHLRIATELADGNVYRREKVLVMEIEGDLLSLRDDAYGALDVYMKGLGCARDLSHGADLECELLRRVAQACLKADRVRDARQFIEEGIGLAERIHDKYEYGVCLRTLGEIEMREGKERCGMEHLGESVEQLSGLSPWNPELAVSELVLGKALLGRGSNEDAGRALDHLLVDTVCQ